MGADEHDERRPGRPKDMAKREAILTAARSLFFERGLDEVGIEEIAAAADVSKTTVYSNFDDKSAILGAVVSRESQRITLALDPKTNDQQDFEQRLVDYGVVLLGFLTTPELIAFDRLMAAAAARHPDMAKALVEAGPRFSQRQLATCLDVGVAEGRVKISDTYVAAGQLIALWFGQMHMECRMGVRTQPSASELEQHIRVGVSLVLQAYQGVSKC